MVLDNCSYNKIKLMHELSSMLWFISHHAINDAKAAGDASFVEALQVIEEDLQRHLERLRHSMCVVTH